LAPQCEGLPINVPDEGQEVQMDPVLPTPKDHAEAVAVFRAQVIGPALARSLTHGELAELLRELAKKEYVPPGAVRRRRFGASTLERWYYAYRQGGLTALRPCPRKDRGRGQKLPPALRELLLDIRREQPAASVPTILLGLQNAGRLAAGGATASTVRRLFREHGLDRVSQKLAAQPGERGRLRLRWEAEAPGLLWHSDVCHGLRISIGGQAPRMVLIHGLLDDHARFVPYLEARLSETEADFLAVLCQAVRRHGSPSALYVDNGACYRGESLVLVCARLGIRLVHAAPYDAPARGKQERFWRTLREQCLDLVEGTSLDSLHAVNVHLWQWLDERYHRTPHGGLVGRTPSEAWLAASNTLAPPVSDERMAQVLELRAERKVKKDSTLQWHGKTYEVVGRYLAGRTVTVISSMLDPERLRLEHLGKPIEVFPVDVHQNAHRSRHPQAPSTLTPKKPKK
jgi:putative transposase